MRRKNLFQIALVTMIVLPLIFSNVSVTAQPAPPGDPIYTQSNPFDSKPTTGTYDNIGTPTGAITNAYDGDFATNINWYIGGMANPDEYGYAEVSAFIKPSANGLTDFAITFLDIKVDYRAVTTSALDDRYRIVAYVDPSATEVVLQDWVTAVAASYPPGVTANPAIRTFSNVAEPNDGVWSWTDVAALRVRVECQRILTNNFQKFNLHEVWLTAYSSPYPASGTMSVQPSAVMGLHADDLFYVDIYVTGVSNMWGYQIMINFSSTVLIGLDYFSYGPFVTALPCEIGADFVAVAFKTFDGDPKGFTGNTPVARVYFLVAADGTSMLKFTKASAATVLGQPITLAAKHGVFASNPVHDVAVTDVTVNASHVMPGQHLEINATVMNQGTFIETIDVTAFYGTTAIDMQQVIDISPGMDETKTFVWDTTDVAVGFHEINAEASIVATDEDPSDNVGSWTVVPEGVLLGKHDIAVTKIVRAYENDTTVPSSGLLNVTKNDIVHINVTVENIGNFSETFTLTLIWQNKYGIENKTNVSLDPGTSKNLTFVWNTAHSNPQWTWGLDRWGKPLNASDGYVTAIAAPKWPASNVESQGVPYEKLFVGEGSIYNYDYTEDNILESGGKVRVNRDIRYPVVKFTYPTQVWVGEPAEFKGGPPGYSTTPPGTTITKYRWDFGDGNVIEGNYPTITHAYSTVGEFLINLTVFNDIGLNSSLITGQTGAPSSKLKTTARNVGVVKIEVSPTTVTVGENVTIKVTLRNYSNRSESLAGSNKYVTIYYGSNFAVKAPLTNIGAANTATNRTTMTLIWNTTDLGPGVYTIKAIMDDLGYETDTTDNSITFDETVTLLWHNIKVTDVTPSKTEATIGDSISVSVTVFNEGNFTETFTVTAYYNDTAIGDAQTVTDLEAGGTKTLEFTWNTADLNSGVYVIKAVADTVTGETVTSDNSYVDGSVTLSAASNLFLYIVIGAAAVVVVLALVGVYFLKFRKPK